MRGGKQGTHLLFSDLSLRHLSALLICLLALLRAPHSAAGTHLRPPPDLCRQPCSPIKSLRKKPAGLAAGEAAAAAAAEVCRGLLSEKVARPLRLPLLLPPAPLSAAMPQSA